ncbi:rRNA maturation RNase YbeY [Vicingus serpentipes]|uniref:Endoribonuclease YbeY n=1 Tax=Vicingus serpentipes TaxID=1926625 RepID=A0A5C6RR84_9FLAO|nr:rRNA maturation RNase YbeY [Vicingus serpentipes]TXB64861.1 rRNA maturation RNase YbeY [Vicingus serpentipes]
MSFFSEDIDFELIDESNYISWLQNVVESENKISGELSFVFCDDEYLHKINLQYLNHDTYTDIITFDYTESGVIAGDIFISIDRVKENALLYNKPFKNELSRVIVHGVLHLAGYKDKSEEESTLMRSKEDFYLNLLP